MRLLTFFLFFTVFSFAQTNDTIVSESNLQKFNFISKIDSLHLQTVSFDYKFKPKDFNTFSIYNPYSKLNDLYYYSNNSIYFSKTVQQNPYQFMRKDSFNPNGVSDFGGGLIIGTMNTIFNSIFQ